MRADLLRQKIKEEGACQNTLIYGAPGTGKTILAMSIAKHPKIERVWMFSVDKGFESGMFATDKSGKRFIEDEELKKMEIFTCVDSPENPRAWKMIDQILDTQVNGVWIDEDGETSRREKEGWSMFPGWRNMTNKDCVIIDQLTQLGISIHNHNMARGFVGKSGNQDTLRVYMEDKVMQCAILQATQYAKFPTICVAQEFAPDIEKKPGEKEKVDSYPMMGSAEFCKIVGSYFNNVVSMDIEAKQYVKGSTPTWRSRKMARSRMGIQIEKHSGYDIGRLLFPEEK